MDEKKYGGYTVAQIEAFLEASKQVGEGLDSYLGDGAIACNIIVDMLKEIEAADLEAENAEETRARCAALIVEAAELEARDVRVLCVALIKHGEFLKAVSLYRTETGVGSKEAYDICETIRRSIASESPSN